MKTLSHPLILLVLCFCDLTVSSKSYAIDTQTFLKIEELKSKYEENHHFEKISLDEAVSDHEKLTQFTRSYGSFLRRQIETGAELTGAQLNLIHVSIGAFLKLTEAIDNQLGNHIISQNSATPELATWLYRKIKISENFKAVYSLYFNQKMLRRIIKDQTQYNPYEIKHLEIVAEKILSNMRAARLSYLLSELDERFNREAEIIKKLETTHTYQFYREGRSIEPIYSKETFWSDVFNALTNKITKYASLAFGSSIGEVEWGPGKLYKNAELIQTLQQKLKPLDLMFEKKTYKLTDYTIPGYWGHVGLWLGTEEQLRQLGLWDHPSLDAFREQIKKGNSIYEVRRWGLNFDNLENFSNLDEILVTRVDGITDRNLDDLALVYENLAKQMEKDYDFTFNALATDKATCTEIIYLSYGNINWPSDMILGRRTISPDNMAELLFLRNGPMELIGYFGADKSGKMLEKNKPKLGKNLKYAVSRETDLNNGPLLFDKVKQECERTWRRQNRGAIKFHYRCRYSYSPRYYSEVPSFRPDIDF